MCLPHDHSQPTYRSEPCPSKWAPEKWWWQTLLFPPLLSTKASYFLLTAARWLNLSCSFGVIREVANLHAVSDTAFPRLLAQSILICPLSSSDHSFIHARLTLRSEEDSTAEHYRYWKMTGAHACAFFGMPLANPANVKHLEQCCQTHTRP